KNAEGAFGRRREWRRNTGGKRPFLLMVPGLVSPAPGGGTDRPEHHPSRREHVSPRRAIGARRAGRNRGGGGKGAPPARVRQVPPRSVIGHRSSVIPGGAVARRAGEDLSRGAGRSRPRLAAGNGALPSFGALGALGRSTRARPLCSGLRVGRCPIRFPAFPPPADSAPDSLRADRARCPDGSRCRSCPRPAPAGGWSQPGFPEP